MGSWQDYIDGKYKKETENKKPAYKTMKYVGWGSASDPETIKKREAEAQAKRAADAAARELAIDSVVRSAHEEAMRRLQQGMGEFQRTDFELRATPAARTSVMTTRQAQNALNKRGIGLQKSWEQKALELAEQAVEERRQFFGDFSRPEEYAEYLKDKVGESRTKQNEVIKLKDQPITVDALRKKVSDMRNSATVFRDESEKKAYYDEIAGYERLIDENERENSAQARKRAAEEYMLQYAKEVPHLPDYAQYSQAGGEGTKAKRTEEERNKADLRKAWSELGGGAQNYADAEQTLIDDYISDEDIATYNYLINKGMHEYADAFWKETTQAAEKKRTGDRVNQTRRLVGKVPDGIIRDIAGSALSMAANVEGAIQGGYYLAENTLGKITGDGQEIDPYHYAFGGSLARDALREDVMKDMGPVGRFLYQTGMSVADSTAGALMLGGTGGAAMMATGAMTDTVRRVKEEGGEDWQAMTLGVIAGGAELLTEKMGFDRLGEIVGGSRGNIFREVLGHMVSEFGEEAGTEIANIVADGLVMWDASEFAAMRAEAGTKAAITEMLKRVGLSGLGGALSGGVMGGGAAGLNAAFDAMAQREIVKQIQRRQATDTLFDGARGSDYYSEDPEWTAAQNALSGGARGSGTEAEQTIARLAEETVAEQEAERQAEAAEASKTAAIPARTAQTGAQAATERMAAAAQARANVPAEVSRAADRYGEDAGVFESHYKGGDADSYARGFEAMYTAGRVGLKMEQIGESTNMLTQGMDEVTKKAIWTAGRNSMMRAVTPGVRRMDTKKATNAQKRQYTMLDAVGKRYGIEFMVVDSIEGGRANGAYSGGRRIVVASDAMDGAIVQAGAHELVHYLKRTDADGYNVLKEVVVGHLTRENSAFILSEAVKERMAEYAGNGQKLTEEDAIEEIVAEAVPTIFASEESVKAFVGKDKTLAEKVRDFIVKFVKEIREIAEKYMQDQGREEIANLINKADALTEIAETFDRALEAAGEKEAAQDGGEAVFARKRSKDADDVSKWTQDSQFMEEIMTAAERGIFRDTLINSPKSKLQKSADGQYIIEAGRALVYTDGRKNNPGISRIVYFYLNDGSKLDGAMDIWRRGEREGIDYELLRRTVESICGEECAMVYYNGDFRGIQRKTGSRERENGKATAEGDRNKVSPDRGAKFSLNSPAFKRWFGDSKIVDEDGSPKVMYHGSTASFTAFDKHKARSSGLYGKGFYFTDSDSHAGQYGRLYQVYLKVQNPLKPGGSTTTKAQVRKFLEAVAENEDDYSIENYGTYDVNEILSKVYSKDAFRVIQDVNATAIGDFVEAVKLFNEVNGTKYDGIVVPTETVVFEPTQIKSATDNVGTYDPDNPDIRFSLNNRSAYGPNQPYDWAGDGTYTSFRTGEEAQANAEEMRLDVDTDEFREWFRDSKVVDEKGEPKIMYHGTSGSGFTQFETYGSNYGLMGTGSYFTDNPEIAESYTKKGKGKTPGVYPVYLSIQKPADMDGKITADEAKKWSEYFSEYVLEDEIKAGQTREEALRAVERGFEQEGMLKDEAGDYVAEFFESQGFDGITHVGGQVFGGTKHRVYIAFEPTQVKSATGNFGDFSAEDADIRFSLNDTSKADSVFTEEGKAMAPDVQLRSKTVAAYAAKALKTGLTVKTEQQITGVANKILKETGSSYDKSTMIENLKKVIGEYAESGATEDTLRALTEMSKAIIEQSSRRDDTLRNQYADLRKKLRETPISLTETQKQEAANEAGSYGEWRKGLFGAVNLTSDGISLDSLWGELSSQYPDMFPPETGEAEMAGKIKDFALMMRPRYENPYGMDMDSAALEMGMRLQGDMMVVAGAKDEAKAMYGSAAKMRDQYLQEYKEKLKEQKQKRVAGFQEIAADLKKAKAAGDSKAQAAVMNRYRAALKRTALDEAFAEVRATYREREAQKAENRMRAELRGKVEKRAAELMKMMTRPEKGKRVPTVMQGVVMDVLEALDINGRNAAGVGEETVKSQAFRAKVTALREFYERVWNQQSRGESPDGLDGLMMTISERNLAEIQDALSALGAGSKYLLREMDSQQLRSLNELLKTVKHTVESVGKLWKMQRYASVAQMGDDAIREMDDRGARRFTEDTMAGKGRDFFALDMMEPVSYGERLGEAGKEIIQGLMDGEKVKFGIVRGAAEATKKMLNDTKTTGYDIGKWRKTIRDVKLGDGRTVRMSETQMMSLYLTAKRPQGMKHLLGEGMTIPSEKNTGVQDKILLTQADVTKMAGMISDQQRALADRMGRYLSTELAKAGNDVTQRLYLYDAFTEENYWPITSDPNELKTQEPEGERAFNAIVNAGFTKPVNQRASNPVIIMDAFDVFNRHVGEMASYVGYAEVMTDALAWLNYRQRDENGPTGKSVKDSMDKLLGKGGIRYLTKLIQDINGARRETEKTLIDKQNRRAKIAAVAGKISVAMQQPTSIVRAAAEIHPAYLIRGIKAGKGAAQEMQKWSNLAWWKANGNYDIGIGKGTDEILWGKTAFRDAVMEKISTQGGLVDPGKMDDWAWARMWSAVKREVKRTRPDLKEGSDEYFRAVAERFEYVCDRTQVVDTVMHRSDMMRSKDGLVKGLTSFMSEPTKSYNMLMRAIMDTGRNPKNEAARKKLFVTAAAYTASVALNAAVKALYEAFRYRDDEDEVIDYLIRGEFKEDWTKRFLINLISGMNPLENIPIVSTLYEALPLDRAAKYLGMNEIADYLPSGDVAGAMGLEGIADLATAAVNAIQYAMDDNSGKRTKYGVWGTLAKSASDVFGLPFSGIMANIETLGRIFDPKWAQTKSEMATTKAAYEKLYEATVGGDKKTALSVRTELTKGLHGSTPKNPKEIDTGVAKILAATDERILKAWQMREQGDQARELAALHKEIQKGGFTDEQTKYAVNNVESIMNGEYESLIEEGKTQEAEALRAKMAMYGMEPETPEEKDMTEELEAKTYQYKHLFAGIRNGDADDVAVIAEVMEAESDAEDPAKSIRSEVSGEFREEYIALVNAGKTREAEALAKKLAVVGIDGEDVEEWVKDDSYEGMKEYVAAGNVYGAREAIDRAIENGATVSGVVSSLNSRFRQEYVDLVMAGRNAEADRMAEVLQELGLYYKDGRTNYFRQSKLNEWVKEAEKKE